MNYILTVPDDRKDFLEELIKAMPFLKARPISKAKAERVSDMLDAIEEIKAIEPPLSVACGYAPQGLVIVGFAYRSWHHSL